MGVPSPNHYEDTGEEDFLDESDIINEYDVDEEELPDEDEEGGSDGEEYFGKIYESGFLVKAYALECWTRSYSLEFEAKILRWTSKTCSLIHMVMYVGTSQEWVVIREYEFYYHKSNKKSKKKKYGQAVGESKQDRIKFEIVDEGQRL